METTTLMRMKRLLKIVLCALLFIPSVTAHGQFLNRLKREVQRSVEDAVIDKAADEAAKKTREAMDKMLEAGYKSLSEYENAERVDADELPQKYDFTWIYRLEMETEEDKMDIVYRLKEDAGYFGTSIPSAMDMVMVMDQENDVTVTYMENEGSKMASAFRLPELQEEVDAESDEEEIADSFTFEKTGNTKEILGYLCEEVVGENEEYSYTMYFTTEADISFSDMFRADEGRLPQGFDTDWVEGGKGLMMEMEMIDKNKAKDSIKMRCTELDRDKLTIDNDDYQFFAL